MKAIEFNFLGKEQAKELALSPAAGRLAEDTEHNSKPENVSSENIYITGDNLDALKLLLPDYRSKVKMIYIDPPYNTGSNGLLYNDKFGGRSTSHAAWLSFMYPRLTLARDFLTDDGVIFVSIGDDEVHYLKVIMDEVYGENNFIATLVRKTSSAANHNSKNISVRHDYVVWYAKSILNVTVNKKLNMAMYPQIDDYFSTRGRYELNHLDSGSNGYSKSLDYPIIAPDGTEVWPGGDRDDTRYTWRWSKQKVEWGIKNGYITFKQDRKGKWHVYYKIYEKVDNEGNPRIRELPFDSFITNAHNSAGTSEILDLFGWRAFEYPKPVALVKHLLDMASNKDSIVLDFFGGSSTTAHAVMEKNLEDNGNRKFIIVQKPEEINPNTLAYRKGYKTIDQIGRERIIRAAEKLKNKCPLFNFDFGFKHHIVRE